MIRALEVAQVEQHEAGIHYRQLTEILRKNSSYSEPSLVSHKHLCAEWMVLQSGYDEMAGLTCLCGKENIRHYNVLRNFHNELVLDPIGSSCVKRFGIQLLGITCMCCGKSLNEDNSFVEAYMKYQPITRETLIIGHKRCATKLFNNARANGRYGEYLKKDFICYFKNIGVKISLDKHGNIDIEYDNPKLTPYIDMVSDISLLRQTPKKHINELLEWDLEQTLLLEKNTKRNSWTT